MFVKWHSFRDPLHGFIRANQAERDLIDCWTFQRLRRIRQLGTGYLLYHGAEHSRFGHSLGVMETASRAFDAIAEKVPDLLGREGEVRRYRQLVRLAALLHDVGHAPFSHGAEELFPIDTTTGRRFRHEEYTEVLVGQSEIGDLIDSGFSGEGIAWTDVLGIYRDPAAVGKVGILLHDLVAGELDADRMDYLARDSLFAGVSYGRYDLARLLDSITAVEDKDGELVLAVENGGLYALEAFILARYFMFTQVYLHEDRRFYDIALTRFLQRELEGGQYPPPANWQRFVEWDDVRVMDLAIRRRVEDHWARALAERRHWKVAEELDQRRRPSADPIGWMQALEEVVSRYGPEQVVKDDAKATAYQRTGPAPYITRQAEREERPKILVLDADGNAHRLEDQSSLVDELGRDRIRIMRLYARHDMIQEVKASFREALRRHS